MGTESIQSFPHRKKTTMKNLKSIFVVAILALTTLLYGCASIGSQVWIPRESEGQKYMLDATLHLPEGKKGPFPVFIFSHGALSPGVVDTTTNAVTRFFLQEGFAVVLPMRSGHGASGGRNHEPTRDVGDTFYSGIRHAVDDLHAAVEYVKKNRLLDSTQIIVGGQSRGGILSVIYAARAGDPNIKGVINFVGNWYAVVPQLNNGIFREAGDRHKVPNLWLYGMADTYSPDSSIQGYLANFKQGGGIVDFKYYPSWAGGHFIVQNPLIWGNDVKEFLRTLPSQTVRSASDPWVMCTLPSGTVSYAFASDCGEKRDQTKR